MDLGDTLCDCFRFYVSVVAFKDVDEKIYFRFLFPNGSLDFAFVLPDQERIGICLLNDQGLKSNLNTVSFVSLSNGSK